MSTRSTMSANRRCEVGQPICHCGNQCRLTTLWTDNNLGRRYWGCADYGVRRGLHSLNGMIHRYAKGRRL
ncbi:unnamed protein product [Prunus armeniaca]